MGKYGDHDRRRSARLGYVVNISYRVKKLGGEFQPGELINISAHGAGVFITDRVFPNDTLELEIGLAGSPLPLKVAAQVAWVIDTVDVGKYRIGVEFADLSEKALRQLERFLNKHGGGTTT